MWRSVFLVSRTYGTSFLHGLQNPLNDQKHLSQEHQHSLELSVNQRRWIISSSRVNFHTIISSLSPEIIIYTLWGVSSWQWRWRRQHTQTQAETWGEIPFASHILLDWWEKRTAGWWGHPGFWMSDSLLQSQGNVAQRSSYSFPESLNNYSNSYNCVKNIKDTWWAESLKFQPRLFTLSLTMALALLPGSLFMVLWTCWDPFCLMLVVGTVWRPFQQAFSPTVWYVGTRERVFELEINTQMVENEQLQESRKLAEVQHEAFWGNLPSFLLLTAHHSEPPLWCSCPFLRFGCISSLS